MAKRLSRTTTMIVVLLALWVAPGLAGDGFFPYEVHRQTLDNGLDVLVIPTPEFKDVLSYNMLVMAGSRNEIEPGKTGLAHLFEHILFRHRWQGEQDGYRDAITNMGAFNNAWTWFDVTYYHPVTFRSNLNELAQLESARFKSLDITEKIFQTESGAVLGEYRRNATDPGLRMDEVQMALMYGDYGYGHTTIGTLEDVKDMPNEYEAAKRFHSDYYRPNNCVLLVSGDVEADEIFELAQKYYGDWESKPAPELKDPPPVSGPKNEHVEWEVDVPPRVAVGYRMPPYATGSVETAVGQLLPELLAGETAPLYQSLRYEKQTCTSFWTFSGTYESFGPGPMVLNATLYKDKFKERGMAVVDEVAAEIEEATEGLANFSQTEGAAETLAALKSRYAYDLLGQMDSPASVANAFIQMYRFERDLEVFDKLVASVKALTPEDVDAFARAHLVPQNRVTVTMAHKQEAGAR